MIRMAACPSATVVNAAGQLRCRAADLLKLALLLIVPCAQYCQTSSKKHQMQTAVSPVIPIATSVCEAVAHPESFDGKLVKIHANFAATWEGAWISDNECEDSYGE